MNTPSPRQDAPPLTVPLTTGEEWSLHDRTPDHFTLIVFYRGLHCPICKGYARQFQSLLDEFEERGVEVVAVSMDDRERAEQTVDEWSLDRLPVGYGLSEADARRWGLYLSRGVKDAEPGLFSEPGLFLVEPDGTLYYAAVNSMPFGRPDPDELLDGLDFVLKNDYPARGEVEARQTA